MAEYPVFKGPYGYKLLVADYNQLKPTALDGLSEARNLAPQLWEYAKTTLLVGKRSAKFVLETVKALDQQYQSANGECYPQKLKKFFPEPIKTTRRDTLQRKKIITVFSF